MSKGRLLNVVVHSGFDPPSRILYLIQAQVFNYLRMEIGPIEFEFECSPRLGNTGSQVPIRRFVHEVCGILARGITAVGIAGLNILS